MRTIEYWEAVERIESSTPNDTPDSYRTLGKYVSERLAQAEVDRANKLLFDKLRNNPGYPWTHTHYFVKFRQLELIERETK